MEYQIYESYDTFLLYQEFLEIPGNTFKFRLPEGMILTTEMMHTFLRAAYMSVGRMDLPSCILYHLFCTNYTAPNGAKHLVQNRL